MWEVETTELTEEGDDYEEEESEEEYDESEDDTEEEKEVVREITDYEQGKTTYLYSDGTYEDVLHQQESSCFIATACYGSPLDKHVVFLRLFRDSEVLESKLGRSFMRLFNRFYYSFSPSLASLIARRPTVRFVSRYFVVAPIIHMFRLSCFLMRPTSRFSREASVFGTGAMFSLTFLTLLWVVLRLVAVLVG